MSQAAEKQDLIVAGSLEALAADANELHAKAETAAEGAVEYAWQCGQKLIEAKAALAHGEWLPWLAQNFSASQQHAARYMKIASNYARVSNLAGPDRPASIRQALKLLAAPDKGDAHVSHNSGENEWYTPPQFLDAARKTMGAIDLDPASCDLANENVKAAQFFSAEENGLDKDWAGNVWMNPPYAQPLIQQFCEKVVAEVASGRVANACVLVNNGTETAWGQSLLRSASAVCFPASRIRFIDKEGNPSGAPLQGQMIVYLGNAVDEFQQAFCKFGVVLLG